MKRLIQVALTLLCGALLLAGCNLEGVASFSPNHDRVAIVHSANNQLRLYTTDLSGGNPVKIEDNIAGGFDVSFDPLGTRLLYGIAGSVCLSNAAGGGRTCPVTLPNGVQGGFLSFLPNGDFVLVYRSGSQWVMQLFHPGEAAPFRSENNVDHFFLTADAFEVKRGSEGAEWYLTPYDRPSGQQNLRWVLVRGNQAILYNVAGSIEGPTPLPRDVNPAVQSALAGRDQNDITSGVISPDGTKMVFRTRAGSSPNYTYGLYALDLATNAGSFVQLVNNASFRVQFAFSPNGSELVYESNADGRSVWIANADGTNPRKLSDSASLPDWQ
jgi:Tol biopolymer transport system component